MIKPSYDISFRKVFSASIIASCFIMTGCSDGSPRIKDATEQTVYINTKGIETEVNEVEPGDVFKIVDEKILDNQEDSRAIVHNLDNTTDTLSMASMRSENSGNSRSSALRSTLMGGLAFAYLTNRAGAVAPRSSSYANQAAYNKSNGMTSTLKNSATPKKISIPGSASRGYGSGKSFRSFGG